MDLQEQLKKLFPDHEVSNELEELKERAMNAAIGESMETSQYIIYLDRIKPRRASKPVLAEDLKVGGVQLYPFSLAEPSKPHPVFCWRASSNDFGHSSAHLVMYYCRRSVTKSVCFLTAHTAATFSKRL